MIVTKNKKRKTKKETEKRLSCNDRFRDPSDFTIYDKSLKIESVTPASGIIGYILCKLVLPTGDAL